jgi:hypothetical protein
MLEIAEFIDKNVYRFVLLDISSEKVALPPQNKPELMPNIRPNRMAFADNSGIKNRRISVAALRMFPATYRYFALMILITYVPKTKKSVWEAWNAV